MPPEPANDIEALLTQAERAHADYEATKLGGTYDESWPEWYAGYAVEHGIGALIGHDVSVDELKLVLARSWDLFQAEGREPGETWSTFVAGRIAGELRPT